MKFDKLKPGMVLYDVHSEKMGNTTVSSLGVWHVRVLTVDHEKRFAMCSWNGNQPRPYYERGIAKLKDKKPILVRSGMGVTRKPTREERKAILSSGLEKTTFRTDEVRALMEQQSVRHEALTPGASTVNGEATPASSEPDGKERPSVHRPDEQGDRA